MKIDAALVPASLERAGDEARELQAAGWHGAFTFEGPHDPFFPLLLAARDTDRLELMTAIAVAFARSPMLLAQIAHDLQTVSHGRFRLGLGSQIRAHIERRFSNPWSRPAARMRELVQAIRAIWRCWNEGERLDFRGEFYTHTLMTPIFDPGPCPHGPPRILIAGVGPHMTRVAGEVGDGFLLHPFHTPEFVRETTRPALERGRERARLSNTGEALDQNFEIVAQVMVATGGTSEELERALHAVRAQIAFYASTPAYRGVLDSIGRGELQPELQALSRRGAWGDMAARVDRELCERIAVCGAPAEVASSIRERLGGFATRVGVVAPWAAGPKGLGDVIQALRTGC